ncbi:TPA: hypothetical protein J1W36_004486 [Escherichia coli]|nr:hypothetical protein [Escherichia coli]HBA8154571.1 hypothetical protein [Escherichia coli]
MTEQRDLQQIMEFQQNRQHPLDVNLAINICELSKRQVSRIRDMSLEELQQQEYVSREEFAYIIGRTFKATGNILDRNDSLVYREHTTPDAIRPKRYAKLQLYWAAIINNKASTTPQEQKFINKLQKQPTHRRKLMKKNIQLRKSKETIQKLKVFHSRHYMAQKMTQNNTNTAG